jgi:hypothetical protein
MIRPLIAALGLLALAGCMDAPAKRQGNLSGFQACRAHCNREHQICMDGSAAQRGSNAPVSGGNACQSELQMCLNRCGALQ